MVGVSLEWGLGLIGSHLVTDRMLRPRVTWSSPFGETIICRLGILLQMERRNPSNMVRETEGLNLDMQFSARTPSTCVNSNSSIAIPHIH